MARGTERRRWSREELLLALNLYLRIPFGRQHSRDPEVVALASALRRTPSSVAMKLSNFTSLDPSETGRVRGLAGASTLDRDVWREYHASPVPVAAESEALWASRVGDDLGQAVEAPEAPLFRGPTELGQAGTVRLAQDFFRRLVRSAYEDRCCVTGITLRAFLVASHIVPWSESEEGRVNPTNGLYLSRLHDAAFDRALVTFDEGLRLVVGNRLRDHFTNDAVRSHFEPFEGQRLRPPKRYPPSQEFLERHRARFARAQR